ncbi:TetR family transcriptional regulator [Streptomyces sp. SID8379]|nr:TetR/AcrR family transcriptional regulator [Streptomyces sp. SID8379]MYW70125.1 TetR family transcriptional regulator [Streptomyces sp. SID8379]
MTPTEPHDPRPDDARGSAAAQGSRATTSAADSDGRAEGTRPPANQGRRVAARNRAALIAAAREVFAEQGLNAPLSAVARRAGVGQGSLYRHFADRTALVFAVLDENVRQIELAAAEPGVRLESVLGVVTWHLTRSTAFVDLLRVRGDDEQARALSGRVRTVLDRRLRAGHRLSADELMLAIAMVSGAVAGPTPAERERLALEAWRLLDVEVGPLRPFETAVEG